MYRLIVATILLGIVLAVLVLRRGAPARTRAVKVTSRAALHRGAFVAVVEIEGRRLLVGAGAQQVNVLAELDPEPPAPPAPPAVELLDGAGSPVADDAAAIGPGAALLERVRRATTRVPRGER